jgi:very-short-patch-repair endonuclease
VSAFGLARCESPIELALGKALGRQARFELNDGTFEAQEVGRWPGWFMALLCQQQIGPYRCDFVIASTMPNRPLALVVEADGHDFHERTKEQARRDRARDRFFAAHDILVLRFTGSEIHESAAGCAEEAMRIAVSRQQPLLDAAFEAWIRERAAK